MEHDELNELATAFPQRFRTPGAVLALEASKGVVLTRTRVENRTNEYEWTAMRNNLQGQVAPSEHWIRNVEVTGTFVKADGHNHRIVAFTRDGAFGYAAIRERKGLKGEIDALTLGDLPTWDHLYEQVIRNKVVWWLEKVRVTRAPVVLTETIAQLFWEEAYVVYYGVETQMTIEVSTSSGIPNVTPRAITILSPVPHPKCPHRVAITAQDQQGHAYTLLTQSTILLDKDGNRILAREDIHEDADIGQMRAYVETFQPQCERKHAAKALRWVSTREPGQTTKMAPKHIQKAAEFLYPPVFLSDMNTKADSPSVEFTSPYGFARWTNMTRDTTLHINGMGHRWLETQRKHMGEMKEELAKVLYHPERMVRMMETYGETWMETHM